MSEARQLFMEVSLAAQKQSFSEVEALNTFRGPQGQKGDKGDRGEKGDTGSVGPAGPQGATGATGETGPQGKQGIQGERGEPGVVVSETEPTDPNVKVWIKPDGEADELEQIKSDVSSLKDQKANVIIDTSARAASHELHAQDGPLAVTLYGKTYQDGEGDPSPDNVRPIHGSGYNRSVDLSTVTVLRSGQNNSNTGTIAYVVFLNILGEKVKDANFVNFIPINAGVWEELEPYQYKKYPESEYSTPYGACCIPGIFATNDDVKQWFVDNPEYSKLLVQVKSDGINSVTAKAYGEANCKEIIMETLPDGAPLMGNGTVDDTVENDVLSGCDVALTFNNASGWKARSDVKAGCYSYTLHTPYIDKNAFMVFANDAVCNKANAQNSVNYRLSAHPDGDVLYYYDAAITSLDDLAEHLAANPLTVFYRSTEYTRDKDLRVCKVIRRRKLRQLLPEEVKGPITVNGYTAFRFQLDDVKPATNRKLTMSHFTDKWAATPGNFRNNFGNLYNVEFVISEDIITVEAAKEWVTGNPVYMEYPLVTPEVYMTDPLDLRKPDTLTTDTVTVTGSGETEVSYPHDTKHFIVDLVTKMFAASQA